MRDSIDRILIDSIVAKKIINELPYYYSMYHVDTLNTKYIIKYADRLGLSGQYNVSFNLLNKAISYTENNAKLFNCKGNIWQYIATVKMQNGEYYKNEMDSSMFYYEKACQTDSNDVELFVTMCIMYNGLDQFDKGIKAIEHAIKLQPQNKDHVLFRGICKHGLKDYEGSYQDLKVITQWRRSDATMYFYRALSESYINKFKESKCDFDTCEILGFVRPDLYYYRGIIKTNINDKYNGWLDIKKAHDMGFEVPKDEYETVMKKLSEKKI